MSERLSFCSMSKVDSRSGGVSIPTWRSGAGQTCWVALSQNLYQIKFSERERIADRHLTPNSYFENQKPLGRPEQEEKTLEAQYCKNASPGKKES